HHSHIEDVFALIKEANVKRTLITHLSNRYNTEDINEIYQTLIQNEDTPNFNFVKDFDSFKV
ncbi:TPA: ribonuclease Z, partial [Staphylococcus aureus]|nr:ribonuclease Z [Staphylococcus aureus]